MDEVLDNPAIKAYLIRLIGEEGINLIVKFPPEGEWSDEQLAAQTGINLNSVRTPSILSMRRGWQNTGG
jgi:transcription initiation factor TFIIE subunit alpha